MKSNKKLKFIIFFTILAIASIFIFNQIYNPRVNNEDDEEDINPFDVEVIDYKVYDLTELNFRFVIVEIKNNNQFDKTYAYEELCLNNVKINGFENYIDKIKEQKYLDLNLSHDQIINFSKIGHILILPIDNYNIKELVVSIEDNDLFTLDLEKSIINNLDIENKEDDSNLLDEEIITKEGYTLKVAGATADQNFIYYIDNEKFESSSQETIHIIPITLISNDNKEYQITAAKFDFDDYPGDMDVQKANFKIDNNENAILRPTTDTLRGVLIFITYSQSYDYAGYSGVLKIQINNNEWIDLQVGI